MFRPGRAVELRVQESETSPVVAHATLTLSKLADTCNANGSATQVTVTLTPSGKIFLNVKYFAGSGTQPSAASSERSSSSKKKAKRPKRDAAVKYPKIRVVQGHHFQAKFFNQFTFCAHCHNFLWGFNKQGYYCDLCNCSVHKRCHEKVIIPCTKNANSQSDLNNQLAARLNISMPHKFKEKTFLTPTFCKHCGQLLWGLYKQGRECEVCGFTFHHRCSKLSAPTCSVDVSKVQAALEKTKQRQGRGRHKYDSQSSLISSGFDPSPDEYVRPIYEDPSQFLEKPAASEGSRRETKQLTINDFHFMRLLGRGSFGKVYLAWRANEMGDKEYYAIKASRIEFIISTNDFETTRIERKVLQVASQNQAPFLLKVFCTFRTPAHLVYVMDFLPGGDLMFHLHESNEFDLPRSRFYAAEIVCALKFLHDRNIVYRDLKLDNVLLDREGHICLADFGMCKDDISEKNRASTFCGTLDYIAPEIIDRKEYTFSVDWWSFGVLLYEMVTGLTPFYGDTEPELFAEIQDPKLPDYKSVPDPACSLMLQCLFERDPKKRLGTPTSPHGNIRDQSFFATIDWKRLEKREITPPFVPTLNSPVDLRYFERDFTRASVHGLSESDRNTEKLLKTVPKDMFENFDFQNDDYFKETKGH